jgi:hypothetical protein
VTHIDVRFRDFEKRIAATFAASTLGGEHCFPFFRSDVMADRRGGTSARLAA